MPIRVWVSSFELARQIGLARQRYNGSSFPHAIHLFQNDLEINAGTELLDFVEADFNGYEPIDLLDRWEEAFEESPGRWVARTDLLKWEPPAEGEPQTIYGAYVQWATELVLYARLAEPRVMSVEGNPLRARLRYRTMAAALFEVV
jgi:hypothetical protein